MFQDVPQRDLFSDFARMRREMDQMLGDAWGRTRLVQRRSTGFSPNVDVYYCGEPQRAVVKVDLAGVALGEVGIEVGGRHLAIAGQRRQQETEGRVYQQIEIPSGPFRRVIELQVEVDAERRQRHLRGRRAADRAAAARPRADHPPRPDRPQVMEGSPVLEVVESPLDAESEIRANQPLPEALPVLPLRDSVSFPETLNPLAVGQARSIQLVNDVLGANRMLVMVASRDPEIEEPGPEDLYDVGVAGVVARMVKVPDGSLRILVQGMQRVRHRLLRRRGALPGGADHRAARRLRAERRARGADAATSRPPSRRSSSTSPTCPRSCASRSPTSTTRRRSAA